MPIDAFACIHCGATVTVAIGPGKITEVPLCLKCGKNPLLSDKPPVPTQSEQQIEEIRAARDELHAAHLLPCTCSSFVRQYEGCCCDRRDAIRKAGDKMHELINKL